MCKKCHPADLQAKLDAGTLTADELSARLARRGGGAAPVVGTFQADVVYDTFSHADHVKAGARCSDCHAKAANALPGDAKNPRREFARIGYEACGACHDPGSSHPRAPKGADGAPAKRFVATWHGAADDGGKKCLECHAQVGLAELKTSEVVDVDLAYTLPKTRFHGEQFAATANGKDDCAKCHLNGAPEARALTERPFRHGVHCANVEPQNAAGRAAASRDCLACHAEQKSATSLAETARGGCYRGPGATSCAKCHVAGGDAAGAPVAAEPALAGKTARKRIEFPHAKHHGTLLEGGRAAASLGDGCFACHDFRPGEAGAFDASVHTKAGAQNCLDCHRTHREIGGGHCADCHRAGDPSYAGKPLAKPWPKPSGFSHYSPGHVAPTEAGDCAACHRDGASVDGAATLSAVRIPDENDPSCRDCHIRQGARFHWR
jgi:hypothetical protein